MKKLTLFLLLVTAATFTTSCNKENIATPSNLQRIESKNCYDFDINSFTGDWRWETRQYQNQPEEVLDMGALQVITFTADSAKYSNIWGFKWTYMDCSIINHQGTQDLYVEIQGDTMYFTGLNDGCLWKLSRE